MKAPLLFAIVVLPLSALAQDGSVVGGQLLSLLSGLLGNELVVTALVGMAIHFYRQLRKDKAQAELQAFDLAVKLAYDGVRNWRALHPGERLDKAEKGLELFAKALRTELGRAPKPEEVESAKLHFDAAHAAEAEAKVQRERLRGDLAALTQPLPGNVVAAVPTTPPGAL